MSDHAIGVTFIVVGFAIMATRHKVAGLIFRWIKR